MDTKKTSFSAMILHNLFILFSITSLLTGLRIATLEHKEVLLFSYILPQGGVLYWHFLSALGLFSTIVAYVAYRIFYAKTHHGNKIILYGIVIFVVTSGAMVYYNFSKAQLSIEMHFYLALLFFLWIFFHLMEKFVFNSLSALKPLFFLHDVFSKQPLVILGIFVGSFFTLHVATSIFDAQVLHVKKIPNTSFIKIDGIADELEWLDTQHTHIYTYGGANFKDGSSDITLQALRNNKEIYLHITWSDPTKSIRHLPLIKTIDGWRILQNGLYNFNEVEYYEDKLAIMFSKESSIGGGRSVYLGEKPLKDAPPCWHKRGYHYTTDGIIRDVWHWKAVRSNYMKQATDSYFGSPDIPRAGQRRYTAGYHGDPKLSGGFTMNYKWYKKGVVVPKRIPKSDEIIQKYQRLINEEKLAWILPWYDTKPYYEEDDTYKVGTILASVLYTSNAYEGDRGDVSAYGVYKDGRWSLEMVRSLKSNSQYDLNITDGIYMFISAFDHAQVAHTKHDRAIKLAFKEYR